jgi:hypothetical protein
VLNPVIQLQNGALDKVAWEAFSKAIPLVLSSPQARSWWEASKLIYDVKFAMMVDEMLAKENFQFVHVNQAAAMNKIIDD